MTCIPRYHIVSLGKLLFLLHRCRCRRFIIVVIAVLFEKKNKKIFFTTMGSKTSQPVSKTDDALNPQTIDELCQDTGFTEEELRTLHT